MWSEGYTAAPGPTEDVYQSVAIEGSVTDLPFLLQKRKAGANHFYFTLTGSESTTSVTEFGAYLNGELAAVELEGSPTLCVTVTLEAYQSKAWLDEMMQIVRPDILLLKVNHTDLNGYLMTLLLNSLRCANCVSPYLYLL